MAMIKHSDLPSPSAKDQRLPTRCPPTRRHFCRHRFFRLLLIPLADSNQLQHSPCLQKTAFMRLITRVSHSSACGHGCGLKARSPVIVSHSSRSLFATLTCKLFSSIVWCRGWFVSFEQFLLKALATAFLLWEVWFALVGEIGGSLRRLIVVSGQKLAPADRTRSYRRICAGRTSS